MASMETMEGGTDGKADPIITKKAPAETGHDPEGTGRKTATIISDDK